MSDRPTQSRRPLRRLLRAALAPVLALAAVAAPAAGQSMRPAGDGKTIVGSPTSRPTSILNEVGIDQKLGTQIPPELTFRDETGKVVRLADYFAQGRPILFTLVYYGCPRLCTMVLNDMKRAMVLESGLNPGRDYDILVVSFDPREGPDLAFDKKAEYTKAFRRPGTEGGWHFLTGDEANVKSLCDAVGFRYAWDEKHQQYIHAGGVMVLTPDGKTSKYFYGVEYRPLDLRLALVEAGQGRIGSPSDKVLLFCFMYDPNTGQYTPRIRLIIQGVACLTVLGLGAFVVRSLRRERTATTPAGQAIEPTEPAEKNES
jgi:protein SCO1/2